MSTAAVLEQQEKPKVDVLQREKMRKEAIASTKYQTQFTLEQNKLMRAKNEQTKLQIEEQELSARSWKAWYEKMHYSLECERIEPIYKEYQERAKARIEEEKKKYDEMQKQLQEKLDTGEAGVKIEKIPEAEDLTIESLAETSNEE